MERLLSPKNGQEAKVVSIRLSERGQGARHGARLVDYRSLIGYLASLGATGNE